MDHDDATEQPQFAPERLVYDRRVPRAGMEQRRTTGARKLCARCGGTASHVVEHRIDLTGVSRNELWFCRCGSTEVPTVV